jgi:hypothetical protein
MPRSTAALAILLTCVVGTARGHDFWIEPSQFVVKPRESVSLYLREGENLVGNSLPYVTDWFRDFSRSDARGREPVTAELGDNPAAVIGIRAAGTTLLGYWSTPNFVSLAPAKFESYLRQEGLEYVLAQRAQLGESGKEARENFVRCAKTYLSTNREALRAALRAPLGFTLELMPPDNRGSGWSRRCTWCVWKITPRPTGKAIGHRCCSNCARDESVPNARCRDVLA